MVKIARTALFLFGCILFVLPFGNGESNGNGNNGVSDGAYHLDYSGKYSRDEAGKYFRDESGKYYRDDSGKYIHVEGPTGPPAQPYDHVVGPEGGNGGNGGQGGYGGVGGFGRDGGFGGKGDGDAVPGGAKRSTDQCLCPCSCKQ